RSPPNPITGRVDGVAAGSQSPAPRVYLSNGDFVDCPRGGSGGNHFWMYTLANVPAGKYSVSAQLFGYRIAPTNFTNPLTISGNLSSINFTGMLSSLQGGSIVGRITERGLPLQDATVVAQVGATTLASGSTDSDG